MHLIGRFSPTELSDLMALAVQAQLSVIGVEFHATGEIALVVQGENDEAAGWVLDRTSAASNARLR